MKLDVVRAKEYARQYVWPLSLTVVAYALTWLAFLLDNRSVVGLAMVASSATSFLALRSKVLAGLTPLKATIVLAYMVSQPVSGAAVVLSGWASGMLVQYSFWGFIGALLVLERLQKK